MDIGSILLILALAVLAGVFVSQPFNKPASVQAQPETGAENLAADQQESRRSALQAEHERLLNALSELDGDYSLGKVPEEDYPTQRTALLQAGASVLRQLDELKPPVGTPQADAPAPQEMRCTKCGAALHADDLFCPRCGQKVARE
jgi:hypothetical protein